MVRSNRVSDQCSIPHVLYCIQFERNKVILCYVMLCYVMLCYVMLCYVIYMISCRVVWYPCRSFQDGRESNKEFVSRLSFVKILVIFNARGPSQTLAG